MKRSLFALLMVASLAPAGAQVKVTTLAEGDTPVTATDQIRLSRFLDLTEVDRLVVGDHLSEFDQISALSERVRIELTCANGSVLEFGEGFRVMVGSTENGNCAATVTVAGLGDVLTEERTETNIGGTALITKGTRYAFRLRRVGGQPQQEVLVFDGEVEVKAPEVAGVGRTEKFVAAGKVVELGQPRGQLETRAVETREIQWWAKRYASFDVVKARAAGAELDDLQAAQLREKLAGLHTAVLTQPTKTQPRIDLAETQSAYRVDREAVYHTEKVRQIDPGALQRYPGLENLIRDRGGLVEPGVPPDRFETDTPTLIQTLESQQFEKVIEGFKIRRDRGIATALDTFACALAYKNLGQADAAAELARWTLRSGTARSLSEQQQQTLRELAAPQ